MDKLSFRAKIFLSLAGPALFFWIFTSPVCGADETPLPPAEPQETAPPAEPKAQVPAESKEQLLHETGDAFLRNRVDRIERENLQLAEQVRFLEDQVKNLDRRVDDLSRHH